MCPEPLGDFGKEITITSQIEARILDFETGYERARKPCHIVRKRLSYFGCYIRNLQRGRSFRHDRVFDLDEFEAALSAAGTVQVESVAS